MLKSLRWALLPIASGLSSCGGLEQSGGKAPFVEPLQWSNAPQKSRFAMIQESVGTEDKVLGAAIRCWDRGDEKHCLSISEMTGLYMLVQPFRSANLPETIQDIPEEKAAGYSCHFMQAGSSKTRYEQISGVDGLLVENVMLDISGKKPWSRSFVNGFLEKNPTLGARPYFRCLDILDVINGGSLATLGSTAISYELVAPAFTR